MPLVSSHYYPVPENPEYDPDHIRQIQDTDPVRATTVVNPVIEKLIENTAAVKASLDQHTSDEDIHVTTGKKAEWDAKVPPTRKVNGKALSEDVSLNAGDVGARPSDWMPTAPQVGADPSGSAAGVQTNLNSHIGNTTVHIFASERTQWNSYQTVHTLTHTKSGTVHKLTGMTGLSGMVSCVFKATAAFTTGNTLTIDGVSYTLQLQNGDAPDTNLFVSGATVAVVVDTAGKKVNFKNAGGGKLPAGWKLLLNANGTFTVPVTGSYRVTVVGKGGDGGGVIREQFKEENYYNHGGGGGGGGWCRSLLTLSKGQNVTVTVNSSTSSFGSYLTAVAGQNGSRKTIGTGGTASGGNEKNYTSGNGDYSTHHGGRGGYVASPADSPFLQQASYITPDTEHYYGLPPMGNMTMLYPPFGNGGSGAGYGTCNDNRELAGGKGCTGVVVIEFVS